MATGTDAYRALQAHLDKMPVGYPRTKSGVELELLKAIFTPEEARIVAHLDYKHKTVDQIYETVQAEVGSVQALTRILDDAVAKGGITRRERIGKRQYAVLPLLLWGMYEHQLKRISPDFLLNLGQYLQGEMGLELATATVPKMRVIPIEESVEAEHRVATYDELRHLIDQAGDHIAIQECMCRKVSDLQGKHCEATDRRELCMSFGDLADLYVEEGWGRKISTQEALEIARRNEQEGLVLQPANEQEPTFMCACCSDCCGMLGMMRNFPRPADVVGSNYHAQVNAALCTACGTCVERCPIEAVTLADGAASINLARCIGCGLCVPTCGERAAYLVRKPKEALPPETEAALYDRLQAHRQSLTGRTRNYLLKSFLRVVSRLTR